ncbi:MAG: hypothetical protein QOF77_1327 [Solirubrobacteraceae bacterium]|nr:hypothetical protein [Solirubrobacteraceae bacterium]
MYATQQQLDDGRWQLRFVRTLRHPVETVWQAITDPDHLAHWFPTTIDGERAAGALLRFAFADGEAPPFDGEMLAFEPPRLMEVRWGTDILRFELRPSADDTILTLLDTLDEGGKAARDGAGWHVCLDALTASLGGEPHPREAMNGWKNVHPHYLERFGPNAATIGPPEGSH